MMSSNLKVYSRRTAKKPPMMNKKIEVGAENLMDLPTNILENIINRLPLREAVRTSILSRAWRYLWANIPELIFTDKLCETLAGINQQPINKTKLISIIYQVVFLHHGPIKEFYLAISELEGCSEIDQIILYLSRRNTMETFTLCFSNGEPYRVPSSLFSCQNLTCLQLQYCVFELPSMTGGFNNLISLDFDEVIFTDKVLSNFIANCPLLESIDVISSSGVFDYLEIDAPKLKIIYFELEVKSLLFKNTTNLLSVYLNEKNGVIRAGYSGKSNMIQLFNCTPLIENLYLGFGIRQSLVAGGVPHKLPTSLVHLRFLEVSKISFGELDELSFALCLIRSSPNLHRLRLQMHSEKGEVRSSVLEFLESQDISDVILNKLEWVSMKGVSGIEPELEFVELLLAKSPSLKRMQIQPNLKHVSDNGLQMLKDMTQFERASSRATLIFGKIPTKVGWEKKREYSSSNF